MRARDPGAQAAATMLAFSVLRTGVDPLPETTELLSRTDSALEQNRSKQLALEATLQPLADQKSRASARGLRAWNLVAAFVHMCLFTAPIALEAAGVFSADFEFSVTGIDSSGVDIPKKSGEYPFRCPLEVATRFRAPPGSPAPFPVLNGTNSMCRSVEQYDYMMTHEPVCSLEDNERCDLLTYRRWVCPEDKSVSDSGFEERCDTTGERGGGSALDSRSVYFKIRLMDWLLAFPLLTSIFHFVSFATAAWVPYSSPYNYERHLCEGLRQPIRWIEYSITSSIMQIGCANLCGITDAYSLVNQFALSISTNMFGLAIDLVPSVAGKWAMFAAGCVGFLASWFQLLAHFSIAFSPVLANEDFAQLLWFVPLVVWSLLGSYLTFPIVTAVVISRIQRVVGADGEIRPDKRWRCAPIVIGGERWYIILSFAAKFILIAIVASAAIGRPSDD